MSESSPSSFLKDVYCLNVPVESAQLTRFRMNDIPEQSPNVDYEPGSDILMNNDRNEKEYDVPRVNGGLRIKRDNVNAPNLEESPNKMLPKVSASGECILFEEEKDVRRGSNDSSSTSAEGRVQIIICNLFLFLFILT